MRYFGKDEMRIWSDVAYHPNTFVYKVIYRALGMSCTTMRTMRLASVSKKAFKEKIKSAKSK